MRDLIIIGGGPAGLTAGIYAGRKYLKTTLITKDFVGQVGTSAWIENYPGFKKISGLGLIKKFKEQLNSLDVELNSFQEIEKIEKIKNGFKIITDEKSYQTKSIIIATGSMPKKLNIKNEDLFLGNGVSYCLTCDEAGFKNKIVAVIGGGNAGAEATIELARFCKKVYLLESMKALCADKILQEEINNNKKIEVITSAKINSFEGKKKLEKIIYQDLKNKKIRELMISGCFIEAGSIPNSDFIKNKIKLNKNKEIKVNPITLETNIKGIFSAGDVNDLPGKQVVIACGQGALAVLSVYKYLQKK